MHVWRIIVEAAIREIDHTKGSLISRGRDTKNPVGKGYIIGCCIYRSFNNGT